LLSFQYPTLYPTFRLRSRLITSDKHPTIIIIKYPYLIINFLIRIFYWNWSAFYWLFFNENRISIKRPHIKWNMRPMDLRNWDYFYFKQNPFTSNIQIAITHFLWNLIFFESKTSLWKYPFWFPCLSYWKEPCYIFRAFLKNKLKF
jgi:hypothetical protein